ncbi:MAG: hypothetical protein A2140_00515 [Candidatus Muproteobacteria bacterium RBG_16_62_13]|uniref:Uncharacterized protein n=1 Tax=Candidatus Muproteobacteria bacterium RBG_16_62_13 TaxID=1817756 RepID=A0A1F6T6Y6_9PROT|nr:MAG: hypothetical protein A2140_00515 [Candidatus Muproteobacteria bacterium RBG_16_62_13]
MISAFVGQQTEDLRHDLRIDDRTSLEISLDHFTHWPEEVMGVILQKTERATDTAAKIDTCARPVVAGQIDRGCTSSILLQVEPGAFQRLLCRPKGQHRNRVKRQLLGAGYTQALDIQCRQG